MTSAQKAGFSDARLARVMPFLAARYIDAGAIPGALVMIFRRGEVAQLDLAGSMDLERGLAMRGDAIFRVYSMTKPITSVAVLMLLEEGRIALDDPVHKYIPDWEGMRVYAGPALSRTVPPARAMRVVDLLRHTSGLTYNFMNRTPVDAAYRARRIAEPANPGGLAGMIADLSDLPLEFSPGEAWQYSIATDVLGYLVETLSGMRFGEFLKTRILGPLGMDDTDFYVPESKRARFASCYEAKEGKLVLQDDPGKSVFAAPPPLESGGAGLCSTARDYMIFCRMLLGRGALGNVRLLSPKTVALMTTNQLPGGREMTEMMQENALFNETGYNGVGFGLGVSVTANVQRTGIPGTAGEYAWGGAASTAFFVDPKEDMAALFMTQVLSAPDRIRLRRDFRTLVYSAMSGILRMSAVLETFSLARWHGPFEDGLRARAQAALESGRILFFPQLAFALDESEKEFLSADAADGKAKNISLDPATGKLQGTSLKGARAARLGAFMDRFGSDATRLVRELLPNYAGVERARTSFRPVEIEGRAYSPVSDDRLLHVDAFPSRPMRGRRILRFFANVAPAEARRWKVGEPFEDFARSFLPRLRPALPGKSWAFEKLGITHGRRNRYDETMLALHDAAKRDAHYQRHAPHEALEFPPGSSWLVYTDQVLHAALGGAFALEQTFHFDVAAMGEPARAPLRVLERLSGHSLD